METKRKKCKVIMLPGKNSKIVKVFESNSLHLLTGREDSNDLISNLGIPQHLYITSDDEIKEGDYYISPLDLSKIHKTDTDINPALLKEWKKIIATTDKSLNLSQPSKAFVEKFVKLGGIDEILVEYNYTYDVKYWTPVGGPECAKICNENYTIKVNSHNEITIHSVKNSWTREEVEPLCREAMFIGEMLGRNPNKNTPLGTGFDEISKNWIKENL